MVPKDPQKTDQNAFPKLFSLESPDTVSTWAELYFRWEVTTSARSQQEQRRDLQHFLDFLFQSLGTDERQRWTPRVSRAFVDSLRKERQGNQRRWSDRTINRMLAHLKTFAKWIHKYRPFPLGDPMAKLRAFSVGGVLELERALTETERQRLLDAADYLPVMGGRSRDKRRYANRSPDQRPRRKGYRPWRNRAIVYTLVETGMRRAELTSIDLADVDFKRKRVAITQKAAPASMTARAKATELPRSSPRYSSFSSLMCCASFPSAPA